VSRRGNDDRGAALISVVVLGLVLMMLVATGLTVASSGLRQAVGVQRSTSALDAAYAGVQDYLARVNLDSTYLKYGNPDSAFSAASNLTRPTPWNPAFGVGTPDGTPSHDQYTTWATVPGSSTASTDSAAKFRYEVDTTQYTSSGVVRLRATGLAGSRTRTILSSIRVKGFVDYAYFTDYEIKDPTTFVSTDTTFDPKTCAVYAWTGQRPAKCSTGDTNMQVSFKSTDLLYGDVHTNDTPSLTCGMTVTGSFETSTPASQNAIYNKAKACSPAIPLKYADTLPMPSTNADMKQDAACLYTGPTQITYNTNGTMTVISPWTKSTGGTTTACGTPGSSLASPTGATVPQLDHDLLYVQNVPASTSDPNYWAPTSKPAAVTCIAPDGTTTTAASGIGWSIGSGSVLTRYPLVGEAPATSWATSSTPKQWSTTTPAYGCRNGDLYVSGTVSTLTTAASENYVYVVDDITYADRTADLLGLVGQSSVIVWNPMSTAADQPMLSQVNLEIDAAMVSVLHTFQVQNNDRGSTRGQLTVFGSIAQKYRGSVASAYIQTDSNGVQTVVYTGYTKGYQYDTLLKTVSPPKFLEPSATSYSVIRYATVPTAFTPTGAVTAP
jgi:Tfp pilus assembly protein PilX